MRPTSSTVPRSGHGIVLGREDATRLGELIGEVNGGRDPQVVALLDEELARARLVEDRDVPADVVTMGSRVVYEDAATGKRTEVTLVYPREADGARGKVSVLSRVGSGLIGLTVGQEIAWPMPRGDVKRLRVIAVEQVPVG
jgi:regulator of nucleoside diphosphate kinase